MIKVKKGNVVDALINGEIDYLIHSTNAQGKFASGVAGEIRKRIPEAYDAYMRQFRQCQVQGKTITLGELSGAKGVINLCGQEYYGYDGKRYANYGAIAVGLGDVFHYLQDIDSKQPRNIRIGLPLIGCGLGGANEEIIMSIIEHCLQGSYKEVTIYKL
jgi:O-acetyl-ADP-ribose deacetylase (regulator of RNase III)